MNKVVFICLFVLELQLATNECISQDSILVTYLLKRIAEQQVKEDNYFLKGIFPSYISSKEKFDTQKKDNNIFYNGLIVYTLNNISSFLNERDRLLIDSIRNKSKPLLAKFKNTSGRDTYNFWRTDSMFNYPYAGILKPFYNKKTLADDMDDTILSLMALDANDSIANSMHLFMQSYINSDSNKVRSLIKMYDRFPAYSAWFGKKFPVVFDVSVLCNILAFVQKYNLQWTKADSASLDLIVKTIEDNYHLTQPVYASPYYPKTTLILYHVARLMSVKKIPQLEAIKEKLISDAMKQYQGSDNLLEKVILGTTLMKWQHASPTLELQSTTDVEEKIEKNDFCFFVGNIPSYFKDFFKRYFTNSGRLMFYHYCPAYNDALLLEYLVIKRSSP